MTTKLSPVWGVLAVMVSLLGCNTTDPEFNASTVPERIQFSSDRLYPEGITYAPSIDRFLVSSLTQGKVGVVDPNGRYADFISDNRLISSLGMKVRDGRLYVCNSDLGVSTKSKPETILKTASLFVFNLADRELIKVVRLDSLRPNVPEAHYFANDITFDEAGNAYITDSFSPVIYKVTPAFEASILKDDPLFGNDPQMASMQEINLNGIVYHPDKFLIVVKSSTGELFKVDLVNVGIVKQVTGVTLKGGDGMVLVNNDLYVVNGQNRVSLVRSIDGWNTASVVRTDSIGYDQSTTNVEVSGRIYTINARIGEVNAAINNAAELQARDYSIQQFK
ncbi:gluconolaconase [Spirosoma soli]|uniref:Gluconolaconase n=1 Tax=Spirosoma soli TaxID=1770529 RepID=A0ABW5M3I3_9BACT